MKKIKPILTIASVFTSFAVLYGCHTVQGVGQDVQSGGQVLQAAATPSNWQSRKATSSNASSTQTKAARTVKRHKPHRKVIKRTYKHSTTDSTDTPTTSSSTTTNTTTTQTVPSPVIDGDSQNNPNNGAS